ncbi:MAG: Gfo/Idh/MocA family oxidoreductase, partial [candidate division FCPU426 bacterium]
MAIIGCGLMGRKRALSLEGSGPTVVCDADPARADALALEFPGCRVVADWREAVALPEIAIVMVCTPHDQLAPIGLAALTAGKHVLIEKPGARNRAELLPLAELAKKKGLVAKVGFNHRFHPAFRQARAILAS